MRQFGTRLFFMFKKNDFFEHVLKVMGQFGTRVESRETIWYTLFSSFFKKII